MNKKLTCIMLVDDNEHDNFFHNRAISKNDTETIVVKKESGIAALEYLKSKKEGDTPPDLIFLDINMPQMSGWEFLDEYSLLSKELQSRAIIIMLTTSSNPADEIKAKSWSSVTGFITKPLTAEILKEIVDANFK